VKEPSKITDEVGERIVQISLQNPEYGARRLLPLLEKDGILLNASAVYRVLKHANLENREKRLERSENQLAVEVMPEETVESPQADFFEIPPTTEAPHWDQEAIESVISDAAEEPELGPEAFEPIIPVPSEESESIPDVIQQPIEPPAEAPEQIPEVAEQKVPSPAGETQMFPGIMVELLKPPGAEPEQPAPEIIDQQPPAHLPADIKATKTTKIRGPWFLTMFNLLLLLLLGFLGFYAWQNVLWTDPEPELIAAIPPATDIAPAKPSEAAPPLSSYRMISERNLFNIAKEEAPAPKKEIDIEIIDPAKKNLGLKLVGTVVLDDSKYSVAIIDNQKISRQEAYREGDQANEVLIKKVMRNKVIIATEEGDKLLIVETETTAKRTKSPSYARQIPGNVNIPSQIPGQVPAARTRSINLDLEEVAAAFEDSEKLLQEVNVAPYTQGDQAAGLRLNRIPAKNIFRKMGLRSRDVIVGINGEPISGPEQVGDFIRTLGNGGEVTITIKRRRRTRQINLNIE
jgi:general secretion pathway protein C